MIKNHHRFFTIYLLSFSMLVSSASFDCKKASLTVEKQICNDKVLNEGIGQLLKKYGAELKDVDLTPSEFRCDSTGQGKMNCSTYYEGCASTSDGGRCCSDITISLLEVDKTYSVVEVRALNLKDACKDE